MRSYEDINYGLRPAKHIERKMLAEAFLRLKPFRKVEKYRYVGFGSTYFSDFTLMHRALGVKSMISIEQDEGNRDRFAFNRPFRAVKLIFGHSTAVLPTLGWTVPTITWLDYDGELDSSVLADIDLVCGSAPHGSVLVVSVNAHPQRFEPDDDDSRVKTLQNKVGKENVPSHVTSNGHLGGWKKADVSREIIHAAVSQAISNRSADTAMKYEQLFNFRYMDGAKMSTVGGVIFRADRHSEFERCGFDDLRFVRSDEASYEIRVPCLTNRELRHLDRFLPATGSAQTAKFIPERDRASYAEVYRFFPTFANSDF